jgi:hypothetical protein
VSVAFSLFGWTEEESWLFHANRNTCNRSMKKKVVFYTSKFEIWKIITVCSVE